MTQATSPVSAQDLRAVAVDPSTSRELERRHSAIRLDAQRILGFEPTDRLQVRVHAMGDDDLIRRYETRRAPGTAFRSARINRSFRTFDLEHYGFEAYDSFEFFLAQRMNPRSALTNLDYQLMVQHWMDIDFEMSVLELLTDTNNFSPSHVIDLAGIPLGTTTDLKTTMRAAIKLLRDDSSKGEAALTWWVPYDSIQLALLDTNFQAALAATASNLSLAFPGAAQLSSYLGLPRTETDEQESLDIVSPITVTRDRPWAFNMILYVDHQANPVTGPGNFAGRRNLGRVFQNTAFRARRPWRDDRFDVWRFRQKAAQRAAVLNPDNMVLWINTGG